MDSIDPRVVVIDHGWWYPEQGAVTGHNQGHPPLRGHNRNLRPFHWYPVFSAATPFLGFPPARIPWPAAPLGRRVGRVAPDALR
jgi:hypothetical protein